MTTEQKTDQKEKEVRKEVVSMRELLECGVHFGHQTKRWDARMAKYIFTSRNDIHIIDLQQSLRLIKIAYRFISDLVSNNGKILFVGTKKQAQEAVESEAARAGMHWVNQRWLGGTLTNHATIRKSVKKMHALQEMKESGMMDSLSKKEASRKNKELARLTFYLTGIKDMVTLPDAIFVVDTKKEQLAVDEANRLGIPIVGVVDTNANPLEVQYPIPANDDAIRAIKLLCSIAANAVAEGQVNQLENSQEITLADFQEEEPVVITGSFVADDEAGDAPVLVTPEVTLEEPAKPLTPSTTPKKKKANQEASK